jgi:hypothetical protein
MMLDAPLPPGNLRSESLITTCGGSVIATGKGAALSSNKTGMRLSNTGRSTDKNLGTTSSLTVIWPKLSKYWKDLCMAERSIG